MNYPPFYVGERVVRTEIETQGVLKKGAEYVVSEIKWCCSTWGWRINVAGVQSVDAKCLGCGRTDTPDWAAKNFAPIQSNFQEISYSKVMEQENKFVNAN